MTQRETYLQAKIDHFVRRSNDLLRMGRYAQARESIESIFALDPANGEGETLRSHIDAVMLDLGHREGRNGAGNGRSQRGALVLCVDQDERVLMGLGASLRRHGYRWVGAANYDEATGAMTDLGPEVVISEVNFEAGPRGFDLFLWMRSNPATKETPFLFHATRIDRDTLIAGKRFGVDDFVVKPADGDVVAAAVAQTLLRRRTVAPDA